MRGGTDASGVQRRTLLTALAALCAATAFAVGAAAFDDAVADADPTLGDDDGPTRNESSGRSGRRRGSRSGSGESVDSCPVCGLNARSLLGALLPAVSPLLLVGLAVATVAAGAVLGLRPWHDGPATADDGGEDRERGNGERQSRSVPPDAAATNEVYRAWLTLTDRVDVPDPETATPGEYARAAVAAGLDRAAVERLREVFEAVRYGDAHPTAERERAAATAAARLGATAGGNPGPEDAEGRAGEDES